MRKLLTILGLAIIVLVLLRVYRRASIYGFESFADGAQKEFLIFKSSTCGACVAAAPFFEQLKSKGTLDLPDGSSVTVRVLDSKTDKAEFDKMNIQYYPTILYKVGDNVKEYKGDRTLDGVMGFLKSN